MSKILVLTNISLFYFLAVWLQSRVAISLNILLVCLKIQEITDYRLMTTKITDSELRQYFCTPFLFCIHLPFLSCIKGQCFFILRITLVLKSVKLFAHYLMELLPIILQLNLTEMQFSTLHSLKNGKLPTWQICSALLVRKTQLIKALLLKQCNLTAYMKYLKN